MAATDDSREVRPREAANESVGRKFSSEWKMTESQDHNLFEERHFTIHELSKMWHFSVEFVRQIVKDEPGVTEWVRQQPGKRRYRVLRVPQSVVERLYRRAQARAELEGHVPKYVGRRPRAAPAVPSPRVRSVVR